MCVCVCVCVRVCAMCGPVVACVWSGCVCVCPLANQSNRFRKFVNQVLLFGTLENRTQGLLGVRLTDLGFECILSGTFGHDRLDENSGFTP